MTVLAVGGGLLLPAGPASAEERVCRGTIGAVTVDNLRVPQDATCTLNDTRVEGTIKVERDGTLKAFGIRVIGNVQAEDARKVVVRNGSVGGSVQIVQGRAARILGTRITGDILFDEQDGDLAANRNRIGGNLQAFQNTGGLSINEAMFYGMAVVCSSGDGTEKFLVREGYNGAFFRADDGYSLAEAIVRLMSDAQELQRMGARSREIIEREVNIRTVVEAYRKAFSRACA